MTGVGSSRNELDYDFLPLCRVPGYRISRLCNTAAAPRSFPKFAGEISALTKIHSMKIKITLTEEMLGTASANADIHREFIASKAKDAPSIEEEVEALGADTVERKAMTIFPRNAAGMPIVWDYQIKGFMKDACSSLSRVPDTKSNKLKAFRKVIDGLIFPKPRMIELHMPTGSAIAECQRPLRAQTAQGERIALAHSETVPGGTYMECEILLLDPKLEGVVKEWLDYGALRGLGQWRNSGKGRFSWAMAE